MTYLFKLYDTGTDPAGGLPPSLGDLTDRTQTPPAPPADPAPPQNPPAPDPAPPADPQNPKEPADPNAPQDDEDNESDDGDDGDDGQTFWEDVDKLRGEVIEVTYPDGVDPMSPEGVYHREKVLEARAEDRFEEYLKKTDPRGYAYLLHRQAGGSDDDFFAKKTVSLPQYDLFKEDQDVQSRFYKASLISSGLDEETAQAVLEKVIKDNKLFEKSDAAYKKAEKDFQNELQQIELTAQREREAYTKSVNTLSQQLQTTINDKLNIIIPDADKPGFVQFVKSIIEYDKSTGRFMLTQPIENDQLREQLEAMFLVYKKGDLKALIQREARTMNRRRLGSYVDKSKQDRSTGGNEPAPSKYGKTLGEI